MLLDPAGRVLAAAMGFNSTEAIFFLASLQESDQGEYRCRSTVFSDQLSNPVVTEQTFSVQASPGGYHTCIVKYSATSLTLFSLSPSPYPAIRLCAVNTTFCVGRMNTVCVDTAQGAVCQCLSGYMEGPESQCISQYIGSMQF